MPVTSSEAVLLGDFNSQPHDLEYEMLVGPKDKFTTRVHHADAFVDTWAAVHKEEAGEPTWIRPPYYRNLPNRRIDYCFVSPGLCGYLSDAWVDTETQGSDHQPYWVELNIDASDASRKGS